MAQQVRRYPSRRRRSASWISDRPFRTRLVSLRGSFVPKQTHRVKLTTNHSPATIKKGCSARQSICNLPAPCRTRSFFFAVVLFKTFVLNPLSTPLKKLHKSKPNKKRGTATTAPQRHRPGYSCISSTDNHFLSPYLQFRNICSHPQKTKA